MKQVYAFAIGVVTYLGISAIECEGLQNHGGHKIYFCNFFSMLAQCSLQSLVLPAF